MHITYEWFSGLVPVYISYMRFVNTIMDAILYSYVNVTANYFANGFVGVLCGDADSSIHC